MKTFLLKLIENLESEVFTLSGETHESYVSLLAVIRALKITVETKYQTLETIDEDNIPF